MANDDRRLDQQRNWRDARLGAGPGHSSGGQNPGGPGFGGQHSGNHAFGRHEERPRAPSSEYSGYNENRHPQENRHYDYENSRRGWSEQGTNAGSFGFGPTGDPWANVYGGRLAGPDEFGSGGWSRDPNFGRDGGNRDHDHRRGYRGDDDRGFLNRATDEVKSWFGDDDAERRRQIDTREGEAGAQHHRGRGPRGYRRSDDRIREDVNDRLTDDPYLDASDIEVMVSSGEVTLTGTVHQRSDKRRAEDVAERVSGVTHLQNNLRVKPSTTSEATTLAEASSPSAAEPTTSGLGNNTSATRRRPA